MANSATKSSARFSLLTGTNPTTRQTLKITLLCTLLFISHSLCSLAQTSSGIQKSDPGYSAMDGCPPPSGLRVTRVTDTCVRLRWKLPDTLSVERVKIAYRPLGSLTWTEKRKNSTDNSIVFCDLKPNTTYEWRVRNICADDKSGWAAGPDFTTTSKAFSSNAVTANANYVQGTTNVQIMPNPNKGNFSLQMHSPGNVASTKLSLYNSFGEKMWSRDAGMLNGTVNMNIDLENKLPAGVYVLMIQQGDHRLTQKVVVIK